MKYLARFSRGEVKCKDAHDDLVGPGRRGWGTILAWDSIGYAGGRSVRALPGGKRGFLGRKKPAVLEF